jgi:hypothetical protein
MTDILIAGGGLTGSAAAIQLGRLGFSVELFERGHFVKENPCGEGLMPAGVAALERLGLNATASAPFDGVRSHFRERVVEGRFPQVNGLPRFGWVSAARIGPHSVRIGSADPEREGARRCACGSATTGMRPSRPKGVGVCTHFRPAPGRATRKSVDVYVGRRYELYATPLVGNELVVAALKSADALQGRLEDQFRYWCSTQPHLVGSLNALCYSAPRSKRCTGCHGCFRICLASRAALARHGLRWRAPDPPSWPSSLALSGQFAMISGLRRATVGCPDAVDVAANVQPSTKNAVMTLRIFLLLPLANELGSTHHRPSPPTRSRSCPLILRCALGPTAAKTWRQSVP